MEVLDASPARVGLLAVGFGLMGLPSAEAIGCGCEEECQSLEKCNGECYSEECVRTSSWSDACSYPAGFIYCDCSPAPNLVTIQVFRGCRWCTAKCGPGEGLSGSGGETAMSSDPLAALPAGVTPLVASCDAERP
jgi:hypothetical protein